MSILIVSPSGKRDPEVGLLYLVGRFLIGQGHHVAQLLCNGASTSCDRDGDTNWRRGIQSCLGCMQEQRELAQWSGIAARGLSEGISPEIMLESSRWISAMEATELWNATYKGIPLAALVEDTFYARFGVDTPDSNNKLHDRFVRALVGSAVRMYESSMQMLGQKRPEMVLLPAHAGLIVKAVAKAAHTLQLPVFAWQANLAKRCTVVHAQHSGDHHECPLLIEDVLALRTDLKTWSPDLLAILRGTEEFLGLASQGNAISVHG
jgi:hypothetical protein